MTQTLASKLGNLSKVIGPAPSELSFDTFVATRLIPERERVRRGLEAFRARTQPARTRSRRSAPKTKSGEINSILRRYGLSIDEALQLAASATTKKGDSK